MIQIKETTKTALWAILEKVTGTVTGNTVKVTVAAGKVTISNSANDWDKTKYKVGQRVEVSGFEENGNFIAQIKSISAKDMVLINVKGTDGLPKALTSKTAGETVSVETYKIVRIAGQQNSSIDETSSEIDATDKDDGGNKSTLAGFREVNGTLEGNRKYDETGALDPTYNAINDAFTNQKPILLRLFVSGTSKDYLEGFFTVLTRKFGGGVEDVNAYSFTLKGVGAIPYNIEV